MRASCKGPYISNKQTPEALNASAYRLFRDVLTKWPDDLERSEDVGILRTTPKGSTRTGLREKSAEHIFRRIPHSAFCISALQHSHTTTIDLDIATTTQLFGPSSPINVAKVALLRQSLNIAVAVYSMEQARNYSNVMVGYASGVPTGWNDATDRTKPKANGPPKPGVNSKMQLDWIPYGL
ncbi:hypothetical protein BD311DRAFT_738631 [Dichomitus squalens]|uniref:Uncharacterized protein n=1 Tax=Dichomitus squalens TaxID=114155 RepID=A0A4Q9MT83_9APHY|nr:hypothetical protein BD311DRAFT_738631 [Dichomitus squalens]